MPSEFFEIARIDGPDAPEGVRGRLGYVPGKGEADGAPAVFVYDLERVWCIENQDCTSQGRIDQEAADHSAWAGEQIRLSRLRGR